MIHGQSISKMMRGYSWHDISHIYNIYKISQYLNIQWRVVPLGWTCVALSFCRFTGKYNVGDKWNIHITVSTALLCAWQAIDRISYELNNMFIPCTYDWWLPSLPLELFLRSAVKFWRQRKRLHTNGVFHTRALTICEPNMLNNPMFIWCKASAYEVHKYMQ